MVVWRGLSQDGLGPTTQQDSNGLPFLEHILKLHPGQGTANDNDEVHTVGEQVGHLAENFTHETFGPIALHGPTDAPTRGDAETWGPWMFLGRHEPHEVPRHPLEALSLDAEKVPAAT
jgi:hypothetical protein